MFDVQQLLKKNDLLVLPHVYFGTLINNSSHNSN